ncbi:MAG: universal stress protein [Acidobacteria bacterium]|nr:universal stress protein [Acidobacteriota bacterium]
MRKIQKILFPTDFSRCADQALDHAIFLARRFGAQLHILHAVVLHGDDPASPVYHFPDPEEMYRLAEESAGARLETLPGDRAEGVDVVRRQRRGIAPATVILEYAAEIEADLIVLGTHGRRGLGRLVLGSVAEEIVRLAECPVLTLREQEEPRPVEELEKILVPVDFSEPSERAVEAAADLAEAYDSKLELLHVVQPMAYPQVYFPGSTSAVTADYAAITRYSQEGLDEMVAGNPRLKGRTETHVLEGYPATAITDFARDHGADLVVISTHGHTGIAHLLLGSVAEKVVRLSEVPVFVLKAFDEKDAKS